jgi:hypothetical protein
VQAHLDGLWLARPVHAQLPCPRAPGLEAAKASLHVGGLRGEVPAESLFGGAEAAVQGRRARLGRLGRSSCCVRLSTLDCVALGSQACAGSGLAHLRSSGTW